MFIPFTCRRLSISPLGSWCFSSSSKAKDGKQYSFTASYLINSCGLSPESAIVACGKLHFETPEKPDSVLTLFRDYGMTSTHIPKLLKVFPTLLLADPEKTLLPKLEFFRSKGFSKAGLGKFLSSCPMILARSLDNQLIPCYNFFKSIIHHDQKVVSALERSPMIFLEDLEKNVAPNIAILREIGVPESRIVYFVIHFTRALHLKHERFRIIVKHLIDIGSNPLNLAFIIAIKVRVGMSESTWEQKMEIYRRWGWNNDEILLLFRHCPLCLSSSEKKIMSGMDFLVNKMGWQLGDIARAPEALLLNLEKTLISRCSVMKVLLLKGLVKKDFSLGSFLKISEKVFLDRYVIKHQNSIPQLLSVYQGKLGFQELGFESEEICQTKQL